MIKQIFIGLVTEGPTDNRFLESIVQRAFEDVAFECCGDMDVYLKVLNVSKVGLEFVKFVEAASQRGVEEIGMMTLCVHADADEKSSSRVYNEKITPARKHLQTLDGKDYCLYLTPVIPVRMMEAWMLADKDLLRREIGTNLTDIDLGLERAPEDYADPKDCITNAIRIAQENIARRRRTLSISELYLPLGQKMSLDKLKQLDSFRQFKEEIRTTYRALGYMHE